MELHTVFKSGTLAHSGCLLIARAIYYFVIKPRNCSQPVSQRKWPKVYENSLIQQAVTVCVTKVRLLGKTFAMHIIMYIIIICYPQKLFCFHLNKSFDGQRSNRENPK